MEKRAKTRTNFKDTSPKKRREGVLLEDIDHKLDMVVDVQHGMASRQEKMEHELFGLRGEFNGFRDETKENFKELFTFRDETRENFKTVFQYLSRIDDELIDIKRELKELKAAIVKKADTKRLMALEERVQYLEVELAKYKNQIL